jgi:hypothetical protein
MANRAEYSRLELNERLKISGVRLRLMVRDGQIWVQGM